MAGKLKKLTKDQAEECVRLYDSGMSVGAIAPYFGVTRSALWQLLKRRTKMRPQLRFGDENHFSRGGEFANDHAQNMVEYAIRKGILERRTSCSECGDSGVFRDGRSKIQAHHDDYNKPLNVRWLCQKCHHKWHKSNAAVRKEELREVSGPIDIVSGGFP